MTLPAYKSFPEFLYKTRNNWIKHIIPVSYFHPEFQVYLEGYITTPVKSVEIDEEEETEEEIEIVENKPVTIKLAFISQYRNTTFLADVNNLYPSARQLKTMAAQSREIAGEITIVDLYPATIDTFRPTEKLPLNNLKYVLKAFSDVTWTKAEIAAMVNRPVIEVETLVSTKLTKDSTRICRITGMESETYKLEDIPLESRIKKDLNMTHKIAKSIDELYYNYAVCKDCDLGVKREKRGCKIVPSRGNKTNPKIFLIGEAPGGQEEEDGIPFNPNAPAGSILAKVLVDSGIDPEICYWTNSVICRPEQEEGKPGLNGKPKNEHITICNSRLKNELAILKPQIVVLLGKTAYHAFFGKDPENVTKSVGWLESNHKVYFVPHPSYIARQLTMTKGEDKERVKKEYIAHFTAIKNAIG